MNLLFFGCLYSQDQKENYLNNSKVGYQFAAQKFQEALIDGFLKNGIDLKVITIPSLSTFPGGYKRAIVKDEDFIYNGLNLGHSLGFINLPFMNRPSIKRTLIYMEEWYNSSGTQYKTIVIYGLHLHLLRAAVEFKKSHGDVRLCMIVPDLPEYMGCNKYYKLLGLKQRDVKKVYEYTQKADYFVFLSDKMVDRMPVRRPYIVVEGIVNDKKYTIQQKEPLKTILYTGGVYQRYGILDLVASFMRIDDQKYRLWICGNGDCVDYIEKLSKNDFRIQYLGIKSPNEVESLQQRATLLVNPRHSNEVYTNYSFPSKTMEYLMSGTATVMCHLGCIPKEYDDYLFYFEDETIEGMKQKMIEICEMDSELLRERGNKAYNFIKNNKNSRIQVKNILNLLRYI